MRPVNSSPSQHLSPQDFSHPFHPIPVSITQHRQQKTRVCASMSDPTTIDTTTTTDDSNSGVDLSPIVPTKDRKNSLEHGTSSIPTAAKSLANETKQLNSSSIPPRRERPRRPQHLASWGTGDSASAGWYLHPSSAYCSPAIIDLVLAELEKAMAQDALKKHLAKRPTKEELLQSELASSLVPQIWC
jgi:hypothetical protein